MLNLPNGPDALTASEYASVQRALEETAGARHRIPAATALQGIIPSAGDQKRISQELSILHIAQILVEEVPSFSGFRSTLVAFEDPRAIKPHRTEEYYLPTFDQEQGSTRGNMIVLKHYFLKVLALPKEVFETVMFFIFLVIVSLPRGIEQLRTNGRWIAHLIRWTNLPAFVWSVVSCMCV